MKEDSASIMPRRRASGFFRLISTLGSGNNLMLELIQVLLEHTYYNHWNFGINTFTDSRSTILFISNVINFSKYSKQFQMSNELDIHRNKKKTTTNHIFIIIQMRLLSNNSSDENPIYQSVSPRKWTLLFTRTIWGPRLFGTNTWDIFVTYLRTSDTRNRIRPSIYNISFGLARLSWELQQTYKLLCDWQAIRILARRHETREYNVLHHLLPTKATH